MKKAYEVKKIETEPTFWTIKNTVSLFFVFMALISIVLGAMSPKASSTDSSWLRVDGFVLSAELETHVIEGQTKDQPSSFFYDAIIRYQYVVNGETLQGSYIPGGVNKNDPAMARKTVDAYPQGRVICIMYNPASPDQTMIAPASACRAKAFFVAGLVFLLGALLTRRLIKENNPRVTLPLNRTRPRPATAQPGNKPPAPAPPPEPPSDIAGQWILDYQIPSMREIISSSHSAKNAMGQDMKAVLASGSESLTVNITNREIEFKYRDAKNQGSCDIVSDYRIDGNTLSLDHKSMDFLMTDIEDFPPRSYTYSRRGTKLTLVSNEIEGLGKRKISYHLTRSER